MLSSFCFDETAAWCWRHLDKFKVIWRKAASPPHTDGSVVFAGWRQCAPHVTHASFSPPECTTQTASRITARVHGRKHWCVRHLLTAREYGRCSRAVNPGSVFRAPVSTARIWVCGWLMPWFGSQKKELPITAKLYCMVRVSDGVEIFFSETDICKDRCQDMTRAKTLRMRLRRDWDAVKTFETETCQGTVIK